MLFVMFEAKMPKFDLWLQQLELHKVTSTLSSSATTWQLQLGTRQWNLVFCGLDIIAGREQYQTAEDSNIISC